MTCVACKSWGRIFKAYNFIFCQLIAYSDSFNIRLCILSFFRPCVCLSMRLPVLLSVCLYQSSCTKVMAGKVAYWRNHFKSLSMLYVYMISICMCMSVHQTFMHTCIKAATIRIGCIIVILLEDFLWSWEADSKSLKLSPFEKMAG